MSEADEVRPALGAGVPPPPPVARIEVLDRDGRVRHALPVAAWPATIGRAIDNDLVLEDPHVAPHHAVIEEAADGTTQLRVLPGRNGMRCGRRVLAAGGDPVPLDALGIKPAAQPDMAGAGHAARPPWLATLSGATAATGGIELVAGQTRLRLRRAGDALEPERDLAAEHTGHAATLGFALMLWLWLLVEQWIALDPGSKASDWLPPLVGAPLVLVGWCLVWGLASKIFQHRFEFWPHLAVAVRGLLAVEVASFVLQWASGISGTPVFARLVLGVTAAIGVATLWMQARLVLPQQRRALAAAALAAYAGGAAILLGLNQQRYERWFADLYASMLPPPALEWDRPITREAFVKEAERLRPGLEKITAEAAEEQKKSGDDSDEE
ncbi:MAG: FHA domain-containing protein [Rubrivivax sp.]|nr:FHA domain-containing protein [Rubrivivax sp.]